VPSIDAIIDELYGLPPEEFTRARNAAAAGLRKEGRRAEAAVVLEQRKPSAGAAALNRLVRDRRRDIEAFLAAAARLRDAQLSGKGDLREAARGERESLNRLVELAGETARQSLSAAAVDEEAAAELLAGRLVRELEPRGFGTLVGRAGARPAGAPKPKPKPAAKPKPKPKVDDRAARARLDEAKRALAAARAEERQTNRLLVRAQREVARAQGEVARAQRELDRVRRAAR